jgi:hypothetical protein
MSLFCEVLSRVPGVDASIFFQRELSPIFFSLWNSQWCMKSGKEIYDDCTPEGKRLINISYFSRGVSPNDSRPGAK